MPRTASPGAEPFPTQNETRREAAVEVPLGGGRKVAILMMVLSLLVPVGVNLGPLRFTPYTAYLFVAFVPLVTIWAGKRVTPIILSDVLMLLFCVCAAVAMIANHGMALSIEPNGIHLLTTFGAFLAGRIIVRDHAAWRYMMLVVIVATCVMLPFVIVESLTGMKPILKAASLLGNAVPGIDIDKRLGLHRAQGAFEHPILMGIFAASLLSIAFFSFRGQKDGKLGWIGAVGATVMSVLSMSTGALLTLNIQFGLMLWGRVMRAIRRHWRLLALLLLLAYAAVDILSNRTPFHVFVEYGTFSSRSSYNRILIWEFGTASVANHPLLGIGLNDWDRPSYMSDSMDNFWLVQAVRYGLPAFLFYATAIILVMRRLARAQLINPADRMARRGMLFSLIGTCVAISSVHLWNAAYVWLNFLLGACVWVALRDTAEDANAPGLQDGSTIGSRSAAARAAVGMRSARE